MKRLLCVVFINLVVVSLASAEFGLQIVLPEREIVLSREEVLALPQQQIITGTPWTDTVDEFTGIALSTLLAEVGWTASDADAEVILVALNDYQITADLQELLAANALLSHTRNAEPMPVRAYGPYWVMFPFDDRPELDNRKHRGWSVWQLKRIELKAVSSTERAP